MIEFQEPIVARGQIVFIPCIWGMAQELLSRILLSPMKQAVRNEWSPHQSARGDVLMRKKKSLPVPLIGADIRDVA
jgi:hypothetical protein